MKKKAFLPYIFLLSLSVFFVSCEKTSTEKSSIGSEYYPIEVGRYWIYDAQSYQYASTLLAVVKKYQVKEVITEALSSNNFKLERYQRASESQAWQIDSVYTVQSQIHRVVRTENNVPYIKLLFPVSDNTTWNANALNLLNADEVGYKKINQAYKNYAETVHVWQQNDSSLVNQDKRLEIYAKNTGLVYKEKTVLYFCQSSPSCIGKGQIDFGSKIIWQLKISEKE